MSSCDQDLLVYLAKDPNLYFDMLVSAYQQKLFVFILFKLRHHQDAEDIIQETFVRAYRSLQSFTFEEIRQVKLRPWLFTVAYHCILNHLNRGKKRASQIVSIDCLETRAQLEHTEDGQYASPERGVEEKEACSKLYICVQHLPEPLRLPVILHYIVGLRYREVAEILNQPFNTVKSNGRRGIEKLQKMLQQQNEEEEEVN